MADELELHVSDAVIFRACRRRWKLGSLTQMNLEPIRPITALWTGSAVHYGLETYYKTNRDANAACEAVGKLVFGQIQQIRASAPGLSDEDDQDLRKNAQLAEGMIDHYTQWAPKWDSLDNPVIEAEHHPIIAEVLTVEHKFDIPMIVDGETIEGIRVKGKMDGVIRDQYGELWILENKTAAQDRSRHHLLLDEQPGIYMIAAQYEFNEPIVGVLYNIMRKKLPAIPERLASGGVTVRKNIDTTYEVYLDALRAADVDPRDSKYAPLLQSLIERGNTFFKRVPVRRSQANLLNLMKRFHYIAQDMQNGTIYASPEPMRCSMCSFEPVCLAMEDNADWRYILQANYRVRSDEYDPDAVVAAYGEQYEETVYGNE